jgi:hypothetical protein
LQIITQNRTNVIRFCPSLDQPDAVNFNQHIGLSAGVKA